jgi:hypothetical protein
MWVALKSPILLGTDVSFVAKSNEPRLTCGHKSQLSVLNSTQISIITVCP